ncbi:MAG: XrtA/PEP-CTERM system histidine kinase PrsK [Saccharospirillum sp.]
MDYSAVTAFAYTSAAVLSLVLTLFLIISSLSERWKWPIAGAAGMQTVWLSVLAISLMDASIDNRLILWLEVAHFLAWIIALATALMMLRFGRWPKRLFLVLVISLVLFVLATTDILLNWSTGTGFLFFCYLLLAMLALVCLEQLVRNASSGRFIRLLGISLALVLLFNVYLYAQGLINRRVDLLLWQARAALIIGASFVIVAAGILFRDGEASTSKLRISRPVAFYSTSLLITSVAIIVLAIGGYYVRTMEGHWGIYAFTLLLFFSLLALSALFFSNHVRGALQVWVSKHFFRHKYDYRQEWLNVIQALSAVPEAHQVYETVYSVIARIFQASGGVLMVYKGAHFHRVFSNAHEHSAHPDTVPAFAAFIGVMSEHEWVFVPQATTGPLSEYNNTLPEWVRSDPSIQLVVPLIAQNQLVGFVALEKPGLDGNPSWEDLDILKTVGRQLANHILIHTQEEQLSEARQLDTYNKLSAFIMHDLNNLIAQLALVVKNSERHKNNPAFIDDMILTVSNAVSRMKGLMQKFSRSDREVVTQVSLFDAVEASIEACASGQPKPQLTVKGEGRNIQADRDRLILALKHLIKNAQEATPETGQVMVDVHAHANGLLTITIADTGSGMTQAFIEQQLFKPFETTKTGQGMGIGAYLTRSYFEELGATLDVTSEVGIGTTFTVTFGAGTD